MLDEIDGDVDLEPSNDDEPSLGWPEGSVSRPCGATSDLEQFQLTPARTPLP